MSGDKKKITIDKDRVYELASDGTPLPVMQAINDEGETAEVLEFGVLKKHTIRSLKETCAMCSDWKKHFGSIKECQDEQRKGAQQRGFQNVVCPDQFIDYLLP